MAGSPTNQEQFTVLIEGQAIGVVKVKERYPRKILGMFTPSNGLEPYRPVFEAAVELARQFDALPLNGPCDYRLWDELMNAYGAINSLGPVLAEISTLIEEFAVNSDWSVEITFEEAPP